MTNTRVWKNSLRATVFAGLSVATGAGFCWEYEASVYKMTSKRTQIAMLESADSLKLPFPYQGRNTGGLMIRRHPTQGIGVIFSIGQGQMTCPSFQPCAVNVRFDNDAAIRFAGTNPSDRRSTAVFLSDGAKFIAKAKAARTILVETTYYKGGNQVLTFKSAEPLAWQPPTK